MEIAELFDIHRQHYVKLFKNFVKENAAGQFEVLLETEDEFSFCRVDAVNKIQGEDTPVELEISEFLDHELIETSFNEKRLLIDPFLWNDCEFLIDAQPSSWEDILEWTKKWMDIISIKKPNEEGITSVIHSISSPIQKEEWISFSIDFGTADSESMLELISILASYPSINTIMIGSPEQTGIT